MAFQSLYRRYRPRRFDEVKGQEHVMRALRNAVRDGTVAHAYLFSGPRGTGKTSSARILAKALNCAAPVDGEPDGTCESCLSVEAGRSMDVVELDAASNNGVDAMRDLVGRVALGTGGRAKVYIVDEVHMLSAAASNALLKTLEEPPAHVTFVLATTDPQKVLPTIRSRTQHFEFRLLSVPTLEEHLHWVAMDAGLQVSEGAVAAAARRGRGSARDALSALDQIVAAGGEADDDASLDELAEALVERDTGRALAAVQLSCEAGREPRQLAESVLSHLRDTLLAVLAPDVLSLSDDHLELLADQGRRMGPPAITRALDAVGEALLAMRESPDPRVPLEVALVRVTRPELDTSPAGLVERIEKLERQLRSGGLPAGGPAPPAETARPAAPPDRPAAPPDRPASPPASPADGPSAEARAALGGVRKQTAPPARPGGRQPATSAPAAAPAPAPPAAPAAAAPSAGGDLPSREALTQAWGDHVIKTLRPRVKGLYGSGRFVAVEDGHAVFAFDGEPVRDLAETARGDVEAALASHFSMPIPVRLVVAAGGTPAAPAVEEHVDVAELTDAPDDRRSGVDLLAQELGAEPVDGDS